MLIMNNGTPKSGSTWLNKIIGEMVAPKVPPLRWRRKDWQAASIHPDRLSAYVASKSWEDGVVMIKTHIPYTPACDYLLQPGIRIIVTYRNLPDSIVSLYHHQVRLGKLDPEKKGRWLRTKGIEFAKKFRDHRHGWAAHSDVLLISYEAMVADAPSQIARVAAHLGQTPSAERLTQIAEATQIRLSPGEAPRDGQHTRTGGESRATLELPPNIYDRLVRMDEKAGPIG